MAGAKITLFLVNGEAKGLRTGEISNWTGKALAAPWTEIARLLERDECRRPGVYLLAGTDPETDLPRAYVGEAETIGERLKQHKGEEWVSAIAFVSKDENLTKAHVRYLEARLLLEARKAARFKLKQNEPGGAKLPEGDREEMEVFLAHVRQLLPVLGFDLLVPVAGPGVSPDDPLLCKAKGAEARGQRTAEGFVVYSGSTAVLEETPGAAKNHPFVPALRKKLIAERILVPKDGLLVFSRDYEFTSPSQAASIVRGHGANGLTEWKTKDGTTLKELDEKA